VAAPKSARLSVIRSAVAEAAAACTLRGVAAEIGMSHTGVLAFLGGGEPRQTTLRKLNEWYTKHAAEAGTVDADGINAALAVLLNAVPDVDREEGRRTPLDALRGACKAARVPPPDWLKG